MNLTKTMTKFQRKIFGEMVAGIIAKNLPWRETILANMESVKYVLNSHGYCYGPRGMYRVITRNRVTLNRHASSQHERALIEKAGLIFNKMETMY